MSCIEEYLGGVDRRLLFRLDEGFAACTTTVALVSNHDWLLHGLRVGNDGSRKREVAKCCIAESAVGHVGVGVHVLEIDAREIV